MNLSDEIKLLTTKLRETTSMVSEVSVKVVCIRHINDRKEIMTEKLDNAVEQLQKASDCLQAAGIELMAASYRLL